MTIKNLVYISLIFILFFTSSPRLKGGIYDFSLTFLTFRQVIGVLTSLRLILHSHTHTLCESKLGTEKVDGRIPDKNGELRSRP